MPRINIEDELFTDKKFVKLMCITGSLPTSLGLYVLGVKLAQRFHLKQNGIIPREKFDLEDLYPLIECGFFKEVEEGYIYVNKDTECAFLVELSIKGKKSAQARAKKSTQPQLTTVNPSQPLTLSLPLNSNSISNSVVEVNDPLIHFKKPEFFTKLKELSKKHGFHFGKQLNMILNRFETFDDFTDWLNILVSGKKELFELNAEGKFSNSAKRYIVGAIARECSNE